MSVVATLLTLQEGQVVTEEQRRWWRVVARAGQLQLTLQDEIILQHGRDILRCDGAHGLQPSLTSKLATVFQAGGESKEVRTRAGLYYRASLHTIALLKRGETVRSVRADLHNVLYHYYSHYQAADCQTLG